MNLEKVIFGFFIVLALSLNFGFFVGDIENPDHHGIVELFLVIIVNLIATGLPCVLLVPRSTDRVEVQPDFSTPVRPRDQILFCGSPRAYRLLDAIMNNDYTLTYVMTGKEEPRSWAMKWLVRHLPLSSGPDQTRAV